MLCILPCCHEWTPFQKLYFFFPFITTPSTRKYILNSPFLAIITTTIDVIVLMNLRQLFSFSLEPYINCSFHIHIWCLSFQFILRYFLFQYDFKLLKKSNHVHSSLHSSQYLANFYACNFLSLNSLLRVTQ